MEFLKFLSNKAIRIVLSLIGVSLITFGLLQLAPGNFWDLQQLTGGLSGGAVEQSGGVAVAAANESPIDQYLAFMWGLITWDIGPSYKFTGRTVEGIIAGAFPVSASLALLAVGLALLVAVPIGVVAAMRQNSRLDHALMFGITLGHALPNYLIAAFLILIFTAGLKWLPSSGWDGPRNLVLPVLALSLGPLAVLTRYIRSSMLDTLHEEYVLAAIAKGGSTIVVVSRHVLRNSLMSLVTVVGPMLGALMTGTLFVEALFRIPGLGYYAASAAASRDMPLLMGTVVIFALVVMLMNLAVDLLYGLLDPRIRFSRGWARARQARVDVTEGA